MSDRPKVMVLPDPEDECEFRLFFGEDEFPHEVWRVQAEYFAHDEVKLTLELPASSVEFKRVD